MHVDSSSHKIDFSQDVLMVHGLSIVLWILASLPAAILSVEPNVWLTTAVAAMLGGFLMARMSPISAKVQLG